MGQKQFIHLYFALEVAKVKQTQGYVVVLELDLEVKEGVFIIDLDDSIRCLSCIDPYALFDAQYVERIDFTLGMADYGANTITGKQIINPAMFASDHFFEMPIP